MEKKCDSHNGDQDYNFFLKQHSSMTRKRDSDNGDKDYHHKHNIG